MVSRDFFLKNRLAVMKLARDFLIIEPGDRLKTIDYYEKAFSISRGTVQSAMQFLTEQKCIWTQFHGYQGTILLDKNQEKLWEYSGFATITGALALPLNSLVSGLATGVCECMKEKSIAFNFAFIQGSKVRLNGLDSDRYDFVIASKLTEVTMLQYYHNIKKVMDLPGCFYSGRYVILFSNNSKSGIEDGMTVAVDPSSADQTYLTQLVCRGKTNIRYMETTYINTRAVVEKGKADATIARLDAVDPKYFPQCRDIRVPEYSAKEVDDFSSAVVLCAKDNYGIDQLLLHILNPVKISKLQQMVVNNEMPPMYY